MKWVCILSSDGSKFLNLVQIKGYKYRAKMILAALVVLTVIIFILVKIIGGISSAIRSDDTDSVADTDETVSEATVSDETVSSDYTQSEYAVSSSSVSKAHNDDEFDADGKLVIDTDTLDGKKAVAITFDDGPGEYTEELVKGLNERGVRATFFMLGSCVAKYPDVLPMMVEGGHQLGSHTYDHTDITKLSESHLNEQISNTDDEIYNACGQRATAFRPPYGSFTDDKVRGINKTVTMWSLDSLDWKTRNAASVKNEIVSKAMDGDIILLHDIYKTSVDGALDAIDELQEEGFVFVTVDELLGRFGFEVEHGVAHSSQYAVFETNSPYAKKYEDELAESQANLAASSASNAFYYDSSADNSDEGTQSVGTTGVTSSSFDDTSSRLTY